MDELAQVVRVGDALAECLEEALEVMQHGPPFTARQRRAASGILDLWRELGEMLHAEEA